MPKRCDADGIVALAKEDSVLNLHRFNAEFAIKLLSRSEQSKLFVLLNAPIKALCAELN
jgi:hypothetical protein